MDNGFELYPAPIWSRNYPRVAAVVGVLVLAAGAYVVVLDVRKGEWLPAVSVGMLCLVLGIGGLGIGAMNGTMQRNFRAIRVRPADAGTPYAADAQLWVAAPRALPPTLNFAAALFTVGALVVFVTGLLQLTGIMPRLDEDGTIRSLGTGLVVMLLFMVVAGALTVVNTRTAWYSSRFCARPRGVLIGQHTVTLRKKDRAITVPWHHVREVVPLTSKDPSTLPGVGLLLPPGSGLSDDMLVIPLTGYGVPPDAVFTALRWYHAHPADRAELAGPSARARMDEWRRTAITERRRFTPRRPY